MRYNYKTQNGRCQELCPIEDKIISHTGNGDIVKLCYIGSYFCFTCNNIIEYNEKSKYVVCSKLIKFKRLEKLEKLSE